MNRLETLFYLGAFGVVREFQPEDYVGWGLTDEQDWDNWDDENEEEPELFYCLFPVGDTRVSIDLDSEEGWVFRVPEPAENYINRFKAIYPHIERVEFGLAHYTQEIIKGKSGKVHVTMNSKP